MTRQQILDKIAALRAQVALLMSKQTVSTTAQLIYQKAAQSLGKHMTLDDTIPHEVGCAEAVSAVLALAGISNGAKGIAGTATLYAWLSVNPKFQRIETPEPGAILVSPTGAGNGLITGHTGIFGALGKMYPGDWGIMSNDSATGLFMERWSYNRWKAYYNAQGGLPIYIYRAL